MWRVRLYSLTFLRLLCRVEEGSDQIGCVKAVGEGSVPFGSVGFSFGSRGGVCSVWVSWVLLRQLWSEGVGFSWVSWVQLRQLWCCSFGAASVRLVKFCYGSWGEFRCVEVALVKAVGVRCDMLCWSAKSSVKLD